MRKIMAFACFAAVVFVGCQSLRTSGFMELYDDSTDMRKEVLKYIPLGTRVEQAEAVMKAHGFHCQYWAGNQPDERRILFSIAKPDPKATWFERLDPTADQEIRVALVCDSGRVIDVQIDSSSAHSITPATK